MMRFEWDEAKCAINVRKHGIDFADVVEVFDHPVLVGLDTRKNYGETRWIALGWLKSLVGIVVFTERENGVVRIISARRATRKELNRYEQAIKN